MYGDWKGVNSINVIITASNNIADADDDCSEPKLLPTENVITTVIPPHDRINNVHNNDDSFSTDNYPAETTS
jgi:hypothetical protein